MTENQPIPVAEAVAAVKAAIEVCEGSGDWEPLCDCSGYHEQCDFDLAARAGYFLLWILSRAEMSLSPHDATRHLYTAVAPIVEWHRAQGGSDEQKKPRRTL